MTEGHLSHKLGVIESLLSIMLKIRLSRVGRTGRAAYRVVVCDHRRAVKGKFIEVLGSYNALNEKDGFKVDRDRVDYWRGQGAKLTTTVRRLLVASGGIDKVSS